MNRPHNRRRPTHTYGRLLFALLVPVLLVTLSSFGYAAYVGKITTVATLTAGQEDISITDCTVISYNGFTIPPRLDWDDTNVIFEDDLLYPGWELRLLTEITNTGTIRVQLSCEIYYWDGTSWIHINEDDLLTLFCIDYANGFYTDKGPDGNWFTPDDTPWTGRDGDYLLWSDPPSNVVYKEEHLIFDAQGLPELQGKAFTFKVDINATP